MLPLIQRLARWAAALALIVIGLVLSIPGIPGPGLLIVLIGVFVLGDDSTRADGTLSCAARAGAIGARQSTPGGGTWHFTYGESSRATTATAARS